MTLTALSLRLLRRRGCLVDVCERWIPDTRIRKDLFGAFDLVALDPDAVGVLGVQVTSLSNLPARIAKLRGLPAVAAWIKSGNAVQLHGWTRRGRKWLVKIVVLTSAELQPVVVEAPPRKRPRSRWQPGPLFGEQGTGGPAGVPTPQPS